MLVHPLQIQQSTSRLLWSGILAAGIFCLLAAWSLGDKTEYLGNGTERSGVTVSVDMPLHVSAEHSLSLKRFFKRTKNQSTFVEPPVPGWALIASEFFISSLLLATHQHNLSVSPHFHSHQLQTLNAPRAPPIV